MRRILLLVAIAVGYLIAARLGLLLAFENTNISPVWPPAGVALAALLLFGVEMWPAITAGAFLANYTTGLSTTIAGMISIGNTVEAIFGFFLIRYLCAGRNPFERTSDSLRFLLSCAACTIIGATVGTAAIFMSGLQKDNPFTYLWWTWWLGDTVGSIVVAPFILAWSRTKVQWKTFGKAIPVFVLLLLISLIVFSNVFQIGGPLVYATVPVVVLAAFRFQQHGASAALFILSVVAIIGTIKGGGPFVGENIHQSLLILQIFIGVIAATAFPVAAVVSERKRIEEMNRSQLKEKEVLLQEIHHRVKNNLQIIASLLEMQSNQSDPVLRNLLIESRNRIYSMALIHETLYQADNLDRINLGQYLNDLVTHIFNTYTPAIQEIRTKRKFEDAFVGVDRAVPVGLIVNEIITNSLMHAFPADRAGEISIELKNSDHRITLDIGDDGIGMKPEADFQNSKSMGFRLISILTKQLNATIQIHRTSGTRYVIEFQQ